MAARLRGNKWLVLSASAIGLFMVITDSTVVNISIPTMIRDLNADLAQIEWVLNAYTLAFAALLITFGRLGDMFGQRKVFVLGLSIFVVGSAACGLAPSPTWLIAFRVGQAVGAAFMMPSSLSLVEITFPPEERGTAFGVWGAISGFALGIGPTLGGFLTQFSWRYIFYVNVPIALLAIPFTLLIVPKDEPEARHRIDWLGVVLSATVLILFNFGMIQGPARSWDALILGMLGGSAVLLGVFIWWEGRATEPLLELDLFGNRSFSAGNAIGGLTLFTMVGVFFLMPLFLQNVLGFSALKAGLTIAPMSLALMVVGPISGHYSDRFGSRWFMFPGLLLVTGGVIWISFLSANTTIASLAPKFVIAGIGMGMVLSPLTSAVMGSVPQGRTGNASGVLSTVRRVGAVTGIAVLGAVLQAAVAGSLTTGLATIPGVDSAAAQAIVTADRTSRSGIISGQPPSPDQIASVVASASSTPQSLPASATLAADAGKVYESAFISGLRRTLRVASGVTFLAALLSLMVTGGGLAGRRNGPPSAG